jgi:hypothetical protein
MTPKVGRAAWAAQATHMAREESPRRQQRVRGDLVEGELVSCRTRRAPAARAEREKEERRRDVAASPYLGGQGDMIRVRDYRAGSGFTVRVCIC